MTFYELSKSERNALTQKISTEMLEEIRSGEFADTVRYFSDEDTYIRKAAYLAVGKICQSHPELLQSLIERLKKLFYNNDFRVRQTVINGAGEIGKADFAAVHWFFDRGLFDQHHSVRNAVIGSMKKMGKSNSQQVIQWAKTYLHHSDKEIRREICHGIELRGRTHPQEILPLLQKLEFDKSARVRNTLIHVLGQIAYKKGCLETVVEHLKAWENKELVEKAVKKIIDVHYRYRNFAVKSPNEAEEYIKSRI